MLEIGRLAALLAALIKIVAKVLIALSPCLPTFSEAMFARRSRHVRLPFLVKAYKNILYVCGAAQLPALLARRRCRASVIALTGSLATCATVPVCSVRSNTLSEANVARRLSNIAS